ncbi:hypothetical protein B296_00056728, partial [Ensete ventricosum]
IEDGVFSFTVDEALLSIEFGKFQTFVLCYAGMGWISEAMEMMLLSFVGPAVQLEWELSSQQESLITSVVFAGMLLGAYSWGIVSDIYGRRQVLPAGILISESQLELDEKSDHSEAAQLVGNGRIKSSDEDMNMKTSCIYPTSVRASGIGIASSVGRIGGITCPLVAVGLVHGCHQSAAVLLFELVIFLSGIAVCLFPLETSGRDLTDSV